MPHLYFVKNLMSRLMVISRKDVSLYQQTTREKKKKKKRRTRKPSQDLLSFRSLNQESVDALQAACTSSLVDGRLAHIVLSGSKRLQLQIQGEQGDCRCAQETSGGEQALLNCQCQFKLVGQSLRLGVWESSSLKSTAMYFQYIM